MSIFLPYDITTVITKFSEWYSLDLTGLSDYQMLGLTIATNLYFIISWGFIIWCILKGINWVYERLC